MSSWSNWYWQQLLRELDKAGLMIVKKPTPPDDRGRPSKPGGGK